MVSDWPPMEAETGIMQTDGDNHADLFGGDLFSDELLDIYSSSDGATDASGGVVPLPNDIPHIMDQNGDGTPIGKDSNNNMGYDGLSSLRTSSSMNDFTSILEEGHTPPPKSMDSMLLDKNNNGVIQQQQQQQQQPQQLSGKKRTAEVPQAHPSVKKKGSIKASTKSGKVNNNSGRRTTQMKTENIQKNVNTKNSTANTTKKAGNDKKGEKNTPSDPLTLQAQNVLVQKNVMNQQTKIQVPPSAPVPQQQPAHVPASTYQATVKTPQLVATNHVSKVTTASSAASVSTVKTEESFKGVAQAAVNNLILSAGQNAARYETGKNDSNPYVKPVDTSTSHVAALTSNNWVAACAASISDAPPGTAEAAQAAALAAASDPAAAKAARARRATLTADERARQNRDRNREHARNTRLRKKAYVEELKRTLTELVTARDATELERRHEKQRELEVREVRYRVMEEFLKLRARGSETNLLARWVAILEEGFTLTIPRTDYRDMVHSQNGLMRQVSRTNVNGQPEPPIDPTVQVLRGATECFDDASKVAIFLQSLAAGNIVQTYNCDRKKFMMDGINAMLEWTLTSMGADNTPTIALKGCMRATFSPASNKLVCAELLFDSGSVVSQAKLLVPFQDIHSNPASTFSCMAETDALLDSVLPQAPPVQSSTVKQDVTLPCSVSVVSADKGESSSDEECLNQQQLCKQEPSD